MCAAWLAGRWALAVGRCWSLPVAGCQETHKRLALLMPHNPRPHPHPAGIGLCSYAFPSLIKVMPAPLLQAARAPVDSGRAARQWIEQSKSRKEG